MWQMVTCICKKWDKSSANKVVNVHRALPCGFIYGIYMSRNLMIFQDLYMKTLQVAHKIKITYEGNKKTLKTKKTKILQILSIDKEKP